MSLRHCVAGQSLERLAWIQQGLARILALWRKLIALPIDGSVYRAAPLFISSALLLWSIWQYRNASAHAVLSFFPFDLACLLWGASIVLALRCKINSPAFFTACALTFWVFVFAYSLLLAPRWIRTDPDSSAFLQPILFGSYHDGRNAGYATFLRILHGTLGLSQLDTIQLTLQLFAFVLGVGILARAYGWWWSAGLLVLACSYIEVFSYFANEILAEAFFLFGAILFACCLAASVRRPSASTFALAALGLTVGIVAKTVGIVFLIPALLSLRFIAAPLRKTAAMILITPAIITYLVLCFNGYSRFGAFRPESMAGLQLVAISANFLEPRGEEDQLTRALISAANPVLQSRPPGLTDIHSLRDLNAYVDYRRFEFDKLLWGHIWPAAARQLGGDVPFYVLNNRLQEIGVRSILAHPQLYMFHVLTQYYGFWEIMGVPAFDSVSFSLLTRADFTRRPSQRLNFTDRYPELRLAPLPSSEEAAQAVKQQSQVALLLLRPLGGLSGLSWITIGIGLLSLLTSAAFFLPVARIGKFAPVIVVSLILQSYVLIHAAFGYAEWRYANTMIPIALVFLFCLAASLVRSVKSAPVDTAVGRASSSRDQTLTLTWGPTRSRLFSIA
jgi:hypothetical protein